METESYPCGFYSQRHLQKYTQKKQFCTASCDILANSFSSNFSSFWASPYVTTIGRSRTPSLYSHFKTETMDLDFIQLQRYLDLPWVQCYSQLFKITNTSNDRKGKGCVCLLGPLQQAETTQSSILQPGMLIFSVASCCSRIAPQKQITQ